MKQIIGAVLIILSIILGIDGIQKFDSSTADVKFLGIRLHAEDKGGKETAFLELALAVVALAGGVTLVRSKNG